MCLMVSLCYCATIIGSAILITLLSLPCLIRENKLHMIREAEKEKERKAQAEAQALEEKEKAEKEKEEEEKKAQ